ncbi:hypothetical protein HY989_04255 [Candidatus Micrarchaeota archaeon]|nr:hypothetical protein [Candidatus Micrarchaeota archaeon]
MQKAGKLALFAIMLLLINGVSAVCTYLQVEAIADATVLQGTQATFPIAIKNIGTDVQNVYLSSTNNYYGSLDVYFDSSRGTLAPTEEKVFTFFVDTFKASGNSFLFPIEINSDSPSGFCSDSKELKLAITPAAPSGAPGQEIFVSISPNELKQLFPGESIEYQIYVTNNLKEEIIASIDSVSNEFASSTRYSETDFRVEPDSTKIITATVTLPAATPGSDYEVVFRVRTSSNCCVKDFLLPVTIRSYYKNAQLSITGEPISCMTIRHGEKRQVPLGIRNYGEITGPFSLQLIGEADALSYVTLPLKKFELKEGERDFFNLSIFIPETATIDLYRFKMQAKFNSFLLSEKNICFKVVGKSNFEVEKPIDAKINRCSTGSLKFKVTNVGTLSDDYSIETKPLLKANAFAEPSAFSLTPGASKLVNLVVQTSCVTPLGSQLASIIVRPRKAAAETSTFEFQIVSSNKSSESFLKIDAPTKINMVAGETKKAVVNVLNTKSEDMPSTSVSVEGLSSLLYTVEPSKTIKSGKTAPFIVTFKSQAPGNYPIKFVATSGLEISKSDATLSVVQKKAGLDFDVEEIKSDVPNQAIVVITLRNNGNVKMTNLEVNTPTSDVNTVPLNYVRELAPGESREMRVQIVPLKDTQGKEIVLKISSAEGEIATQTIQLPALDKLEIQTQFDWKLIAVFAMFIIILIVISKRPTF